jgi:hypothetical protein
MKIRKYFGLRYLALMAVVMMMPLAYANAAVSVGVGVGVGPVVVGAAPVCSYGYYPYYPYACAPYGYYGPSWFVGGAFIGAGPWYHGWGHPVYPHAWGHGPFVARGYAGHPFAGRGFAGHAGGFRGGVRR